VTRLTGSRRRDRARSHCVRLSIRPVLILPQSGRSDSGECDSAFKQCSPQTSPKGVSIIACPSTTRCTGFTDRSTADQCGDEGARRGALGGRQQREVVLGTGFLVVVDRPSPSRRLRSTNAWTVANSPRRPMRASPAASHRCGESSWFNQRPRLPKIAPPESTPSRRLTEDSVRSSAAIFGRAANGSKRHNVDVDASAAGCSRGGHPLVTGRSAIQ
jgi:hypothetical protein